MREMLARIAEFAYQYGIDGARVPSLRGNCEIPVPKELTDDEEES